MAGTDAMQIQLPFERDALQPLESTPPPPAAAKALHDADVFTEHVARTSHLTSTSHPAPGTSHVAPIFIRHPTARRYVVRVRMDGSVRVTIPRWGSKRAARAFVEGQRRWIEKQLRRAEEERARPRVPSTPSAVGGAVREPPLLRAKHELPARLLELAAEYGLRVTRVSVRNQKWRWGSCSRNGHICLNWRLADMPASVRDYVLIHELMHLKRMDHSPKFWKLVARACPAYQEARRWLRANRDPMS